MSTVLVAEVEDVLSFDMVIDFSEVICDTVVGNVSSVVGSGATDASVVSPTEVGDEPCSVVAGCVDGIAVVEASTVLSSVFMVLSKVVCNSSVTMVEVEGIAVDPSVVLEITVGETLGFVVKVLALVALI